jgi:hypothetical protein
MLDPRHVLVLLAAVRLGVEIYVAVVIDIRIESRAGSIIHWRAIKENWTLPRSDPAAQKHHD